MRSIWAGLTGALLLLGLATAAWAQNGLERFEKDIKPQLELKNFSYGSGAPLGNSGFVLNDVVAVVPASAATGDKESTVKIKKVTVDELDFERLTKDASPEDSPRFAKLKLEGITGDDELFTALKPYGVPNVPVDVALDYRIDTAAKVLHLNNLEMTLRGQASIALGMVLEGISDKTSASSAKDDGRLRSATLTYDDKGLLAKVVPPLADAQGLKPDDVVKTALASIAGFAAPQGPQTLQALDAIASFITDWKTPKGALTLGLKPAKTAGVDDLDKIMMPNALTDLFGFTATYPGTRPGAAKAGK